MEKKLSDYLHLYLGCDVKITGGAIFKLVGILPKQAKPIERGIQTFAVLQHEDSIIEILAYHCKPILRRLDSMTEEEKRELLILRYETFTPEIVEITFTPANFHPKLQANQSVQYKATLKYEGKESTMMGTISFSSLNPIQFKYILSKSFDLFQLIDSGLALDSSKIKTPTQ